MEFKRKFEGYKSFKIGVDDENVNQILSPDFWGKGVRCFCKRVCSSSQAFFISSEFSSKRILKLTPPDDELSELTVLHWNAQGLIVKIDELNSVS